ncbi:MAG: anthranilate phosphoribosyltransferase [Candidatus Altiarchaeales archaeon HGW-Altiarchaeales-3]|nr:MAG: anthranilate phosphoribosyltransferase [Candidatus Altiarchaeales archaeon HGW-Altiarchaeales-3]
MKQIIQKLVERKDLTPDEAKEAMQIIMSGDATDAQIAGFLTALRMKGETAEEIAALALIMRKFAENIHPKVEGTLVDTCGTGGDKLNTFNISTAAMFVVAGAGIPIAKHGNRSVSSLCGSADVLEALGVKIDIEPKKVTECIEKVGIGFMFAPLFHKSMKYVMPARTQLGIRTVFNILGPLSNPANAQGQVIGVFDEKLTEKIAEVLKIIGLKRAMVVHGMAGLDEISTIGETKISELINGEIDNYIITPEEFGLERANGSDLSGGNAGENAKILIEILKGEERGAKRDIVLINAAAGIVVGGKAKTISEGLELAKGSIDSGRAYKKLKNMIAYK